MNTINVNKLKQSIDSKTDIDDNFNPYSDYDPEENMIEDSNLVDNFDDDNDFDDQYGNQSSFEPIKRQRPDGWN